MTQRRSRWRTAAAVGAAGMLVALALGPATATPNNAGQTASRALSATAVRSHAYAFDVTWSLLPELRLATGELTFERTGDSYVMGLSARAKLTLPPVDWQGFFAVEGARGAEGATPTRFERRSIRPQVTETVVVAWDDDPTPATSIKLEPSNVRIDREAVDPTTVRDVIDPLSFMARMLETIEATDGARCELTAETWDGVRLAEIQITTLETVTSARTDCKVVYRSLTGLRNDTPWRANEAATLRLVRFEKKAGVWRPIWLKIDGEFGGVRSTFTTTIRPKS